MPGKARLLNAALGPFLEMAISGILTIKLEEKDGATTAVVTYRVSGDAEHQVNLPLLPQAAARRAVSTVNGCNSLI